MTPRWVWQGLQELEFVIPLFLLFISRSRILILNPKPKNNMKQLEIEETAEGSSKLWRAYLEFLKISSTRRSFSRLYLPLKITKPNRYKDCNLVIVFIIVFTANSSYRNPRQTHF